jgi:hypothetical protein
MSNNLSMGPVQVLSLDVASLNLAFAEIQNRLDQLKGLRGRSEVWDRVQVSSPVQASDAIDLGSLEEREALFHLTLLASATGIAVTPGTTYAEVSTLLRQPINFAVPVGLTGRLIAGAWGTDSGASEKGLALTDDDGTVLVEVEWAGADEEVRIGAFTSITAAEDLTTRLYAKGATAEETLVLYQVAIEFRFDSGAGVE